MNPVKGMILNSKVIIATKYKAMYQFSRLEIPAEMQSARRALKQGSVLKINLEFTILAGGKRYSTENKETNRDMNDTGRRNKRHL